MFHQELATNSKYICAAFDYINNVTIEFLSKKHNGKQNPYSFFLY